jgi:hypothetical protein
VPHAQWNNLPHETKIADSLRSFKTILEQKWVETGLLAMQFGNVNSIL